MSSSNSIKALDQTKSSSSTPASIKQFGVTSNCADKSSSPTEVKINWNGQPQLIGRKKKAKKRVRKSNLTSEQRADFDAKKKARADKALRKESKLARDRE